MSQYVSQKVRPEILSVLSRLRNKIRTYVFLEGIALVACAVAILFWLGMAINYVYFKISNLELPFWFRALFNIGSLCVVVLVFLVWVLTRTLRQFRTKSLALVLEKQFPQLDDRLITAVEAGDSTHKNESELTEEMRSITIEDAAHVTKKLDISKVFSKTPLLRALIIAVFLFVSIGGLWAVNAQAVESWFKAYIRMDDRYWQRETTLDVHILAYPGERIKKFKEGVYKHPKGGMFELVVTVPEGSNPYTKTPWKVPASVNVIHGEIDEKGNFKEYVRKHKKCRKTGDREFRFDLAQLDVSMKLWVEGGDFINREPYTIQVVPAPTVDHISLVPYYPKYTRLNSTMPNGLPRSVNVTGTEIALPMETQFVLKTNFNKPVYNVQIKCGQYIAEFGRFPSDNALEGAEIPLKATLVKTNTEGRSPQLKKIPPAIAETFISTDGMNLQLPLVMTKPEKEGETPVQPEIDAKGAITPIFSVTPGSKLEILLEDRDGIKSIVPVQLTVNGIVDLPPKIESELVGVGSSITRKGSIPFRGSIKDDYGTEKAQFEFRIDDAEKASVRPFQTPPVQSPIEYPLSQPHDWRSDWAKEKEKIIEYERFDVLRLDLRIGQKLTLNIYAKDGDNLNGPHESRSEPYVFTIVSREDLLAQLYQQEVSLRSQFERIIKQTEETNQHLTTYLDHLTQISDINKLAKKTDSDRKKLEKLIQSVKEGSTAERNLVLQIHKDNQEIEEGFRDIFLKLVNNRIHERQVIEERGAKLITPLHSINTVDFKAANEALSLFEFATEEERDPKTQIEESIEQIDELLEHMRAVLAQMKELMSIDKFEIELKKLIDIQREIKRKTEQKQKEELLKKLKELE